MTNEELERILVGNISYINENANRLNVTEALSAISRATQALLMVRQALCNEKALEDKYGDYRG